MDKRAKEVIADSIISMGYYWMGEENRQAAESIKCILNQLHIEESLIKRKEDFESDFVSVFGTPDVYDEIHMPEGKCEDQNYMWAAGICLMNMFKSGNFEIGYSMLMDIAEESDDTYAYVISSMKNEVELKNMVSEWLMQHFFMACDLLGRDEIKMMGYTISRNPD